MSPLHIAVGLAIAFLGIAFAARLWNETLGRDHAGQDSYHAAPAEPQRPAGMNFNLNAGLNVWLAIAFFALAFIVFFAGVFFLGGSPSSGTVSSFIGHHWLTLFWVWVIAMAGAIALAERGDHLRTLLLWVGAVLIGIWLWGYIQNWMKAEPVRDTAERTERQKPRGPFATEERTLTAQPSDCDVKDPSKWQELKTMGSWQICVKGLSRVHRQFGTRSGWTDTRPTKGLTGWRYCAITGQPEVVTYNFDSSEDCTTLVAPAS